jgi:hypothetical protein
VVKPKVSSNTNDTLSSILKALIKVAMEMTKQQETKEKLTGLSSMAIMEQVVLVAELVAETALERK